MNGLRKTKNISEVSSDMKKLWVWYGLELLVGVSRKEWPWSHKKDRSTKLLTKCVRVGDEALALEVIELRGCEYMDLKRMKENREDTKLK